MNEQGRTGFELPGPIVLAHELRSHLATINLAASHMRRRLKDAEDQQVLQALGMIDKAVGRATELTAFVLASAPEPLPEPVDEPRRRVARPVDVVQIVRDVVEDLRFILPSRDVHVRAVDQVEGQGDDVRIRKVLTNVLLNAIRQTPQGSAVQIDVQRQPTGAHVTVEAPSWAPTQPELDELGAEPVVVVADTAQPGVVVLLPLVSPGS